jgi:SAM-dependent methyltransferase
MPKATKNAAAGKSKKQRGRKAPRGRRTGVWRTAANSDRHELYELAVQEVVSECDFIERVSRRHRGGVATSIREDFCGTAKASTEWVRRRAANRAIGVDLDRSVIEWGERRHRANLPESVARRITILEANVLEVETPGVEVIVAMNFSYFIFKDRATLVAYFRNCLKSLAPDGILVCDAYGGSEAHSEVEEDRSLDGFTYVWDQNQYNPITGDVVNHIHFRFPDGSEMKRAFTYRWRLWSLPEIQDAMREAGFAKTTVYWEGTDEKSGTGNGVFRPSTRGEACAGWIAYIVAEQPRAARKSQAARGRSTSKARMK